MVHSSAFLGSLLVLFLCVSSSSAARNIEQNIDDVCQHHKNPPFCLTILNEKSGPQLSMQVQFAIATALVNCSDAQDMLSTLAGETTEASLKAHYEKCGQDYDEAFLSLAEASKRMDKRQFSMVTTAVKSVLNSLQQCEASIPANSQSAIKENIDYMRALTEIIQIAPDVMEANGEKEGPLDAPEGGDAQGEEQQEGGEAKEGEQ